MGSKAHSQGRFPAHTIPARCLPLLRHLMPTKGSWLSLSAPLMLSVSTPNLCGIPDDLQDQLASVLLHIPTLKSSPQCLHTAGPSSRILVLEGSSGNSVSG